MSKKKKKMKKKKENRPTPIFALIYILSHHKTSGPDTKSFYSLLPHRCSLLIFPGRGRYILLVFDCMLVVGIYFCADMPSALLPQIQGMQVGKSF